MKYSKRSCNEVINTVSTRILTSSLAVISPAINALVGSPMIVPASIFLFNQPAQMPSIATDGLRSEPFLENIYSYGLNISPSGCYMKCSALSIKYAFILLVLYC